MRSGLAFLMSRKREARGTMPTGPTPKQIVGIVLILGSAVVAMPLESTGPLLICGMASMFGLLLLLKGGQR